MSACCQTNPDTTWYSRNCKDENKVRGLDRKTMDICFVWNLRFFLCVTTKALLEVQRRKWTPSHHDLNGPLELQIRVTALVVWYKYCLRAATGDVC